MFSCWYCHKGIMEEDAKLGSRWYKCPLCGATHFEGSKKKKKGRKKLL